MAFDVHIKDTQTDNVVVYRHNLDWFGEFIWEEGNYCCDCNRSIFFRQAGGTFEGHVDCSTERFDIIKIVEEDGTVYVNETI
jgi:hypothetical protein